MNKEEEFKEILSNNIEYTRYYSNPGSFGAALIERGWAKYDCPGRNDREGIYAIDTFVVIILNKGYKKFSDGDYVDVRVIDNISLMYSNYITQYKDSDRDMMDLFIRIGESFGYINQNKGDFLP